jgi:AcrR family transcriptional regulator
MAADEDPPRALRKDAERNRLRIVDAARAALAEHGMEVSMEEIARRAGVGIGTLYRRFPNRQDLVEAVFLCKAQGYLDAATAALDAPDGWTGFAGYLERLCELQVADRSLSDVLTMHLSGCPRMSEIRNRWYAAQLALIDRAQLEGSLRADLVPEDVVLILLANAGVIDATAEAAPDAWRRSLGLMLDAMRATSATPLPDSPCQGRLLAAFREPRPGRRARPL